MSYILLIEDNQANADMTIRVLESAGFVVKHFIKGFDGAQIARNERPDLILMDIDLPDIDGRTLTLLLRKQLGGNAAPPIVAVTARTGVSEMRLAAQFGCTAFIGKPFLPEELLMVVKRLMPASKPQPSTLTTGQPTPTLQPPALTTEQPTPALQPPTLTSEQPTPALEQPEKE